MKLSLPDLTKAKAERAKKSSFQKIYFCYPAVKLDPKAGMMCEVVFSSKLKRPHGA